DRRSATQVVEEFLASEGATVSGDGELDVEEPGAPIHEAVAITTDGWAFVPDADRVQLVPPGEEDAFLPAPPDASPEEGAAHARTPVNPRTGKRLSGWQPTHHLGAGDLVAARVRRGAPDFDPWRLEALGRDREYRAWFFETQDAGEAALALLTSRIVRSPVD